MSERVPIEEWPKRLAALLKTVPWPWNSGAGEAADIIVLRETDSTQDAARRLNPAAGSAIIAWRQRAGRGRLGRTWADTGQDGVAMTIVMERNAPERLAIFGAVTAALAAEAVLKRAVGIKWPNDILVEGVGGAEGKKLAGVLVEQFDDKALLGIGMNVHQRAWPEDLADRAVSLRQLGAEVDRIDVAEAILCAVAQVSEVDDAGLAAEFTKRDMLRGREATFRIGSQVVHGMVIAIEPMRGLLVQTKQGQQWLPASSTTLVNCAETAVVNSTVQPV